MSRFDLSTPLGRLHAYLDYLWTDHAWLRLGFQNAHWISQEVVRTNQPWPFQLKRWRDKGVKTVLNLRGEQHKTHHLLEADACERLGLKLVDFVMNSREAPTLEQVVGARRIFETIEYPCLMHCKSGADRAGVMAVLYAHFRLGLPVREAARQLSLRYGHFKQGDTGVLDYAFELYLKEADATGVPLEEWVGRPDYDHHAIKREFKSQKWGRFLTDVLLRRE
jgi:protein tyrosine/serine phosphatase